PFVHDGRRAVHLHVVLLLLASTAILMNAPRRSATTSRNGTIPATRWIFRWIGALLAGLACLNAARAEADPGTVKLTVVEKNAPEPIPCRVHVKDPSGK